MRTIFSQLIIVILIILTFTGCRKFQVENEEFYGNWIPTGAGNGWGSNEIDFDYLKISNRNEFKIYKNDEIISLGKIRILNQKNSTAEVKFILSEGTSFLPNFKSQINIQQNTLGINELCGDCSWFSFRRCESFSEGTHHKPMKTIPNINLNRFSNENDDYFNAICFPTKSIGFISLTNGTLLTTQDGGVKWETTIFEDVSISEIEFISKNVGFIAGTNYTMSPNGSKSYLLRTDDGGLSWNSQLVADEYLEIYTLKFTPDGQVGYGIGLGNAIKTNNGGATWEVLELEFQGSKNALSVPSRDVVFFAGANGAFYNSFDGGKTWKDLSLDEDSKIYDISFVDESIGFYSSASGLMKTSDGGKTWIRIADNEGIHFIFNLENDEKLTFGNNLFYTEECSFWSSGLQYWNGNDWFADSRIDFINDAYKIDENNFVAISSTEFYKIMINQ